MADQPAHTSSEAAARLEKMGQRVRIGHLNLRIELLFLAAIALFAVGVAIGFLLLGLGEDDITGDLGYPMLWAISLIRASSVLIPMPGAGLTLAAGGLMDPLHGIPVPLAVGVTVGTAESIGEFTGYAAGVNGGKLLEGRRLYEAIRRHIHRRAYTTMFVLALAPSPVFDVGGLAAGAARLPIRVFYPPVLVGKIIRATAVATAGLFGFELLGKII